MMRGSAVPTIVWSIAASSMVSSRPVIVPTSCGFVSGTIPAVKYCGLAAAVASTDVLSLSSRTEEGETTILQVQWLAGQRDVRAEA